MDKEYALIAAGTQLRKKAKKIRMFTLTQRTSRMSFIRRARPAVLKELWSARAAFAIAFLGCSILITLTALIGFSSGHRSISILRYGNISGPYGWGLRQ